MVWCGMVHYCLLWYGMVTPWKAMVVGLTVKTYSGLRDSVRGSYLRVQLLGMEEPPLLPAALLLLLRLLRSCRILACSSPRSDIAPNTRSSSARSSSDSQAPRGTDIEALPSTRVEAS